VWQPVRLRAPDILGGGWRVTDGVWGSEIGWMAVVNVRRAMR
jgi:hypothetical protein